MAVRAARGLVRLALLTLALPAAPVPAVAQIQQGVIHGTVTGPDGRPLSGAMVTLVDGLGTPMARTTADGGVFRFSNVAPGTYAVQAEVPPLTAVAREIRVTGALPVRVDLQLAASTTEGVLVVGDQLEGPASGTRVTLAGDAVRRAPARVRSRGLLDAVATTPGWSTEDNGLLHARGVDDGFLYVIDGVPVYERLDGLFGVAPDPAMVDSVNVVTGYVPPEFGLESGGVIEVRSAGRAADRWMGTLDAGGGSDDGRDVSTVAGGPTGERTALTVGLAGSSSSRYLDPVHPDNFHNDGGTLSGGGQSSWAPSIRTSITAVAGFGRSTFDVPHGEEQEDAGQDQRQRLRSYWQTGSWQRVWSGDVVSQVAGYHRFGSSALDGSPDDTPVRIDANRTLRRWGALASVTVHRGAHVLKIGGEVSRLSLREAFRFIVVDPDEAEEAGLSEAAIAHTAANPFVFAGAATPALASVYVQDTIRTLDRLTVDIGVRADWTRLLDEASQVSPRAGAAYRWPSSGTTLRASVGRFFQPPQPEYLLLASSPEARALSPFVEDAGEGGADVQPERQTALEAGVSQALGRRARLDVAYWRRWVTSVADPNVLFGTTIVFPNNVARGRASGVDVRLEAPRHRGWSGYLSYANASVVQFGPITGGLFLEDEFLEIRDGTAFTPDHDQRHVGAFGVTWDAERFGTQLALTGRYESGTPLSVDDDELDELAGRPGAERVDFARGRVKPRTVLDVALSQRLLAGRRVELALRASLLNLTGRRWAYNFGNPFSGTHFGPGRTLHVGVRAMFR
ncbi:MAG: TonB-dependent receptor [Acidobacteriota bacterium]